MRQKDSIHTLGGKARAAKLTPEQRKAIASAAAKARWQGVDTRANLITKISWHHAQITSLEAQLAALPQPESEVSADRTAS